MWTNTASRMRTFLCPSAYVAWAFAFACTSVGSEDALLPREAEVPQENQVPVAAGDSVATRNRMPRFYLKSFGVKDRPDAWISAAEARIRKDLAAMTSCMTEQNALVEARLILKVSPDGAVAEVRADCRNDGASRCLSELAKTWRFEPGPDETVVEYVLSPSKRR